MVLVAALRSADSRLRASRGLSGGGSTSSAFFLSFRDRLCFLSDEPCTPAVGVAGFLLSIAAVGAVAEPPPVAPDAAVETGALALPSLPDSFSLRGDAADESLLSERC